MKRLLVPLLLIVALAAIAVAGYLYRQPAEAQTVVCADPLAGCAFKHRGTVVNVRFGSPPSPLKAFKLSVHAPGARSISASFQMSGMEMGFNRYDLRPQANAPFAANVSLPVCISGRHDWTMYLDIDGSRYAVPFRSQ